MASTSERSLIINPTLASTQPSICRSASGSHHPAGKYSRKVGEKSEAPAKKEVDVDSRVFRSTPTRLRQHGRFCVPSSYSLLRIWSTRMRRSSPPLRAARGGFTLIELLVV